MLKLFFRKKGIEKEFMMKLNHLAAKERSLPTLALLNSPVPNNTTKPQLSSFYQLVY